MANAISGTGKGTYFSNATALVTSNAATSCASRPPSLYSLTRLCENDGKKQRKCAQMLGRAESPFTAGFFGAERSLRPTLHDQTLSVHTVCHARGYIPTELKHTSGNETPRYSNRPEISRNAHELRAGSENENGFGESNHAVSSVFSAGFHSYFQCSFVVELGGYGLVDDLWTLEPKHDGR